MMDELVIWARWWNLACYFLALMILLYKFVLTQTLCDRHPFEWVRLVLALHLTLGFFSLGEIILTDADWGWRTYCTVFISAFTVWVAFFKVKVGDQCDDV